MLIRIDMRVMLNSPVLVNPRILCFEMSFGFLNWQALVKGYEEKQAGGAEGDHADAIAAQVLL